MEGEADDKPLPVLVRDRAGEIQPKETRRLNTNNRAYQYTRKGRKGRNA